MPAGLQVWDANGVITLDTSTRTGRVLGYQTYTASTTQQLFDITIPRQAGEQVFAYSLSNGNITLIYGLVTPDHLAWDASSNLLQVQVEANPPGYSAGTAFIMWGVV